MVLINKDEKTAIAKRFPDAHIVRTMKGDSKRHHYYCEETLSILRFLNRMRGLTDEASQRKPRDARRGARQNGMRNIGGARSGGVRHQ